MQRHRLRSVTAGRHHQPEFPLVNQISARYAEASGQDAIGRARRTAAQYSGFKAKVVETVWHSQWMLRRFASNEHTWKQERRA